MRPCLHLPLSALALVLAGASAEAAPSHLAVMSVSTDIIPVANARNPYGNIDRRNDAGNDTGDSQVDRLNEQQLDRNYRGPYYVPGAQSPPPPAVGYVPPAPPPVPVAPRYYRRVPPGYVPPPRY